MCKILKYWLCCCCRRRDDISDKEIIKQRKRPNGLQDYSSPSQLEVHDLTTVHNIPKVNKTSLDKFLAKKGYKLEEQIGGGSYATVYKTMVLIEDKEKHLKPKQWIACKVVDISNKTGIAKRMEEVKNELFVLETIKHPNIIQMYEHFIVDKHKLYIFMAYASGGDLGRHLQRFGPFDDNQCRLWFTQIVNGVNHLHNQKIAHRDIKLPNILLNEHKTALISDFGLSQVSYRSEKPGRKGGVQWSRSLCGTLPYMSPEIIENMDKTLFYDPFAADVWALGVVLFILYNKRYPFDPQNNKTMTNSIRKKSFQWNPNKKVTNGFKSIILWIFETDPDLRVKCNQLLSHLWVKNEFKEEDKTSRTDTSG